MKTNYHTHHYLCGHAGGNAEEYTLEAIKEGFEVLGFSDHAPSNIIKDHGVRMESEKFNEYLDDVKRATQKYADKIKIFTGIEVEFLYNNDVFFSNLHEKLDYLMLGQHYIAMNGDTNHLTSGFGLGTKEEILKYGQYLVDAFKTGYFTISAHPDLFMHGYEHWDETCDEVAHMICKAALENNIILEFNANGFRRKRIEVDGEMVPPYPRKEFWNIVEKYDVKTMINSDCHSPKEIYDHFIKEAEEVYRKLKVNKIEYLDLKETKNG